jgi:hypothetical protein
LIQKGTAMAVSMPVMPVPCCASLQAWIDHHKWNATGLPVAFFVIGWQKSR